MVHWTEKEKAEIAKWKTCNQKLLVEKSLNRMFKIFPWTHRYFKARKDFKVEEHALRVSGKISEAVINLDKIKENFAELSKFHAEVLHVDSGSFPLLTFCIVSELAILNRGHFSPQLHGVWYKFFAVLVSAISKQYH
ncbi:hemoglobin subunit beta-like [Hemiscyllium ocellatum]|uniref:hemoglobin subunit beta-like n=1 Tax=Hemiscyllium ocellatum TaxID=170820 RepID=UPI002965D00E|nr:hemoglobin subunit beta-like [Hemiscyllium ocellatum]